MPKSIALIFHKNEPKGSLRRFAIWHLAEAWREEGIKVFPLFGVDRFVPADLALLHVDLSVVPEEYLDFVRRYPVALNGRIHDIRKSSFSSNKVKPGDGYDGKVIVKSELNYGGEPERKLLGTFLSRLALRAATRYPIFRPLCGDSRQDFRSPDDYRIYDNPGLVPKEWFTRDDLWIEKFLPEAREGRYFLRSHHFLGDRGFCVMRESDHPVIHAATTLDRREVDPDPEILGLIQSMHFDFGKFDYVIHGGKPVLLDTNKTPGVGGSPAFFAMCREWAKGIRLYL